MTSDEKVNKAIEAIQIGIARKDIAKIQAGRELIDEQNFPWETVSVGVSEEWERTLEQSGDILMEDFSAHYDDTKVESDAKETKKRKRMKARNFTRFSLTQLEGALEKLQGQDLTKISMGEMRSIKEQIEIRNKKKPVRKTKGSIVFDMLKDGGHTITDIATEADCSNDYVLQMRWNLEQKGQLDGKKRRADKQQLKDKVDAEKIRHDAEVKEKKNLKKK